MAAPRGTGMCTSDALSLLMGLTEQSQPEGKPKRKYICIGNDYINGFVITF